MCVCVCVSHHGALLCRQRLAEISRAWAVLTLTAHRDVHRFVGSQGGPVSPSRMVILIIKPRKFLKEIEDNYSFWNNLQEQIVQLGI